MWKKCWHAQLFHTFKWWWVLGRGWGLCGGGDGVGGWELGGEGEGLVLLTQFWARQVQTGRSWILCEVLMINLSYSKVFKTCVCVDGWGRLRDNRKGGAFIADKNIWSSYQIASISFPTPLPVAYVPALFLTSLLILPRLDIRQVRRLAIGKTPGFHQMLCIINGCCPSQQSIFFKSINKVQWGDQITCWSGSRAVIIRLNMSMSHCGLRMTVFRNVLSKAPPWP